MTETVIARRYARALLQVTRDHGDIPAADEHLRTLVAALKDDREIQTFLKNPRVPAARKREALHAALEATGAPATLASFVSVLCRARRAALLPAVAEEFARMADEARGVLAAGVSSAAPMAPADLERVRERLAADSGKEVRIEAEVDGALLGGIAVRIGNKLVDGTLRARLEQMRSVLK